MTVPAKTEADALASAVDPSSTLADHGPIDVTFVNPLGWIVTAAEKSTGRIWAQRYGCSALP